MFMTVPNTAIYKLSNPQSNLEHFCVKGDLFTLLRQEAELELMFC